MDLTGLLKPIPLPPSFTPPETLTSPSLIANPLNRTDVDEDLHAVNSSRDLIRRTRGGSWPASELTYDFNFLDLSWHECEFRNRTSFAYAVRDREGVYVGCFYFYMMGTRKKLDEEGMGFDCDGNWWVTEEGWGRGLYEELFEALKGWVKDGEFGFGKVFWSNAVIPGEKKDRGFAEKLGEGGGV